MTTPFQIDTSHYWEGLSATELVQNVRRRLGVGADDTNRYSNADVIQALNMGAERFAHLTACLLYPVVIIGVASRQSYRLPYHSLRVVSGRFYTGSNAYDYIDLRILDSHLDMAKKDPEYRGTSGNPLYLFPNYRAGNVLQIGVSPIQVVDGVNFVADDYGLMTSATGFEFTGNITGLHKTGFTASTFLVDSAGRNLSNLGAKVGYPVFNVTDDSSGVITAIGNQDATNDKITATLDGGTNDFWTPDDSFQIPMSEYGVILDSAGDEAITFSSMYGVLADIQGGVGNFVLDVARKPLPLSSDLTNMGGMISEIPAAYQEAQIAFATYWLASGAFKGTSLPEKAQQQYALFQAMVNEYLGNSIEVAPTSGGQ